MHTGRRARSIHRQGAVVHRSARDVDEMGTDFVEKPLPVRTGGPQDRRRAVPDAKALVTKRAERAFWRAGEHTA
jgi:hypothetical protein